MLNFLIMFYYLVRKRFRQELLFSFLFGFFMAFVTLLCYDRYLVWNVQLEQYTTTDQYYQNGYISAMQNLEIEEISLHEKLQNKLRILCMVTTCPKYHQIRAIHIQKTWGRRCTKLVFISSQADNELQTIPITNEEGDDYENLWNKTREGFRYVYEHFFEDYDWFLKADDDTYIVMENLRYMLYPYDPDIPIYFGYKMKRYDVEYMSGGASYVLSREALRRYMQISYVNDTLCPLPSPQKCEDFYMGICLQNAGVLLADSRNSSEYDEKNKFLPLNLLSYMDPNSNLTVPDWIFDMSTGSVDLGLECCSHYTISFHYADPALIYALEFMLYYFQVFGQRSQVGKLPETLSKEFVYNKFTAENYVIIPYKEMQKKWINF